MNPTRGGRLASVPTKGQMKRKGKGKTTAPAKTPTQEWRSLRKLPNQKGKNKKDAEGSSSECDDNVESEDELVLSVLSLQE